MEKIYDVLIFGAGVVGTCLATDLARSGYSVCLVDKASDVSTGASKANSGLVHAGFDAKPGTLKAKLNVEGNKMYPSLCKRLGLKLRKLGAVVIGNNTQTVKELYDRGIANGVKNLFVLSREELLKILPNITENVTCGLLAKDAYVVCPYLLTICMAEEAIINGATVLLEFDAKKIRKNNGIFEISDGKTTVFAKKVINSAGAGVNDVAKLLKTETYPIVFKRGEYFVLEQSEAHIAPVTVFPLPEKGSKGILITQTLDGNILVGPTSYESDDSTKTTREGLNLVAEKSGLLLSNVNLRKSIRQFSGVRTICGEDFVIEQSKIDNDVLTLAGICSPGLSSAPAISKYAIEKMGLIYNPTIKNKQIEPYFLFKDLKNAEKNQLLSKDHTYGELVCKCENITKGDILNALDRPLKIHSVDGIKRRVRAGMGRCQGGFCSIPVAEIIAKTRKIPLEEVLKENKNSNVFTYPIRGGERND